MATLGDDVDRCSRDLERLFRDGVIQPDGSVRVNYEYKARQLVRAMFAFIEAVTFSVKVGAAQYCLDHGRDISDPERFFAVDIEHVMSDKGEIVARAAHIRLANNTRFAFALHEKAFGIARQFDPSTKRTFPHAAQELISSPRCAMPSFSTSTFSSART